MRWLLMSLVLLVAGCSDVCLLESCERRQAQEREKARQATFHAKCVEYGFKPETLDYAKCRQELDMAHQQRRDAALQQIIRNQPRVTVPQLPPPSRSTTTNCTRYGNTINCTTQ